MRRPNSLRQLLAFIEAMKANGVLEPEQSAAIRKQIRRLDHALRTQDVRGARNAIDGLARIILR